MTEDKISVLVTGIDWMGSGIGSIESAIEQLFQNAKDEILLTVYSISNRADLMLNLLEVALSRGVEAKMIINQFNKQPSDVTTRLRGLAQKYPHFQLHDFVGKSGAYLHAKCIVVDRRKAVVGSSNLSKRGLLTNYELALLVEGSTATKVASVVDRLLVSGQVTKI